MKKLYMWGIIALGALMTASCSEKNDNPGGDGGDDGTTHTVTIRTNVIMNTQTSLITELTEGHSMNLWAKAYGSLDATDVATNIKATHHSGQWEISPAIKIANGQNAFLWATYPHNPAITDPTKIPVDINTQTDYLYSGNYVPASYTTYNVVLNMKHAQSLLAFNIAKKGYSGAGKLTNLKIEGDGFIATKGTMDVRNGRITPTEYGAVSTSTDATLGDNGISGVLPAAWVVPFICKNSGVTVTLTIDGKDYSAVLPEISMATGWMYILHGVLTPNGLVFIPADLEQYPLNKTDDQMGDLIGYGSITFGLDNLSTFPFPVFTGDNIFGNINANGKNANYFPGGAIETNGANSVVVETWNTTGFTIPSFEGIDEIDLSSY